MKESEDNLENFFRNRAESNQYDFEEGDWDKMEAKLDADMPVVSPFPFSNLKWMAIGSALTAILILGYNEIKEPIEETKSVYLEAENVDTPAEVASMMKPESFPDEVATTPTTKIVDKVDAQEHTSTNQSSVIAINEDNLLASKEVQDTQVPNVEDDVKDQSIYPSSNLFSLLKQNNRKNDVLFVREVASNNISNNEEISGVETKKVDYTFNEYPFLLGDLERVNPEQIPFQPKRFYTLSLVGGMDITSTKESDWGTPTFRFGVNGEYFVGKRWSIGIGANLSKKKYQAKGSEYTPPQGFWTNGIVPDSTNAICDVLDVPLTVSYFQPLTSKSNLIISGGVSSWFMLKEEYWYKYKSNDPNLVSWWGGENENRYWFSVINLSMAYEYSITNKWSVAVGPYLNIPLSGVGHGKVELQSFGLKGALRFNKFKLSKF